MNRPGRVFTPGGAARVGLGLRGARRHPYGRRPRGPGARQARRGRHRSSVPSAASAMPPMPERADTSRADPASAGRTSPVRTRPSGPCRWTGRRPAARRSRRPRRSNRPLPSEPSKCRQCQEQHRDGGPGYAGVASQPPSQPPGPPPGPSWPPAPGHAGSRAVVGSPAAISIHADADRPRRAGDLPGRADLGAGHGGRGVSARAAGGQRRRPDRPRRQGVARRSLINPPNGTGAGAPIRAEVVARQLRRQDDQRLPDPQRPVRSGRAAAAGHRTRSPPGRNIVGGHARLIGGRRILVEGRCDAVAGDGVVLVAPAVPVTAPQRRRPHRARAARRAARRAPRRRAAGPAAGPADPQRGDGRGTAVGR